LLAEIDAPDVDQQLNQARAVLQQAETNLRLAKLTAPRYRSDQYQFCVAAKNGRRTTRTCVAADSQRAGRIRCYRFDRCKVEKIVRRSTE